MKTSLSFIAVAIALSTSLGCAKFSLDKSQPTPNSLSGEEVTTSTQKFDKTTIEFFLAAEGSTIDLQDFYVLANENCFSLGVFSAKVAELSSRLQNQTRNFPIDDDLAGKIILKAHSLKTRYSQNDCEAEKDFFKTFNFQEDSEQLIKLLREAIAI